MRMRWIVFVLLLWVGLAEIPDGWVRAQEGDRVPIPVGVFLSLTGEYKSYGVEVRRGIELAVDAINQAGGIQGRSLNVIVRDDASQPVQATRVVLELIKKDGVKAVIGGTVSSLALTAAQVCQREKIPLITPYATSPMVTATGDYIFRVSFDDRSQAGVMARFVHEVLGLSDAVIMRNVSQTYSMDLARFFADVFQSVGGRVIKTIDYDVGTVDFVSLLEELKSIQKRFAIYIPGYEIDTARILRTVRRLGLRTVPVGSDTWDSRQLLRLLGNDFAEGYYTTLYDASLDNPVNRTFVNSFLRRYGAKPTPDAMAGYEAIHILAKAMERASALTPMGIKNALYQVTYRGPVGAVRFNADGNSDRDVVIINVKKGRRRLFRIYGSQRP